MKRLWVFPVGLLLCLSCAMLFCEYLIYYCVIFQCDWSDLQLQPPQRQRSDQMLHALFLSDTHLLGALRGHWFDKLHREWQMERSFQTALQLLQPEIVFILGYVFDEGTLSSLEDWDEDVQRFRKIFRHPEDMDLVVLMGNHDIGHHHEMNWSKMLQFQEVFNITSAEIKTKKGVNFLLVNSMALHGDGCPVCQGVHDQLFQLSREINCSIQSQKKYCQSSKKFPSSPPIILQHYPLYRVNNAACTGVDAVPPEARHLEFREQYDVLSKEASLKLLWWFQPRLILSGHMHRSCEIFHRKQYLEVSIASFSWRNRNNPSFLLGTFSSDHFRLSKCLLPEESSVIALYCGTTMAIAVFTLQSSLFTTSSYLKTICSSSDYFEK